MTDFGFQSFSSSASTGLNYQGTWNASTNSPLLASGVGTSGDYYVVSVAGTTNLDGITDWLIGDWAIFNGTAWQKIDNSGISYQGTWDALTNNPFLQSSIGFDGHFYIVSVAGSTNLNGITTWNVGDWAIFTGGVWLKINNTSGIGGSGTTNYISKFTSASAIGDSQLFDDGTNVGVNNNTPTAKLDIKGIDILSTSFSLKISNSTPTSLFYIANDGVCQFGTGLKILSGGNAVSVSGLFPIYGGFGNSLETNFLGISNDISMLGAINFNNSGFSKISSNGSNQIGYAAAGNHYFSTGNIGVGTLPTAKLHIQGIDATSSNFALKVENSATTNLFSIRNDGVIDVYGTITPRLQSIVSSANVTPTNLNDEVVITAQAVGLTLVNPTGTAVQGQSMIIRIKDNGTARTIAYDTQYRAIGVTLPTTTVINKILYLGLIYNSTDTKWDVIGVSQEA